MIGINSLNIRNLKKGQGIGINSLNIQNLKKGQGEREKFQMCGLNIYKNFANHARNEFNGLK